MAPHLTITEPIAANTAWQQLTPDGRVNVPVLYVDLDGTVRHGKEELGRHVNTPEDVVMFPEAVALMRVWKLRGGRVVGVSNQGGIALGYTTTGLCEKTMSATNWKAGRPFDKIVWCPHHPLAPDPDKAKCWCRKPSPGLIIRAAMEMTVDHPGERYPVQLALMVGDRPEDHQCAEIAQIPFQWAATWRATATGVEL